MMDLWCDESDEIGSTSEISVKQFNYIIIIDKQSQCKLSKRVNWFTCTWCECTCISMANRLRASRGRLFVSLDVESSQ